MNWEDILKNIQISSQKTSSRDYVRPEEDEGEEIPDVDEEDCRQWWIDLMDMCDELLDNWRGDNSRVGYRGNVDWMSKELSCEMKQVIIEEEPTFIKQNAKPDLKRFYRVVAAFGSHDRGVRVRFSCSQFEGQIPILEITMLVDGKYIYDKIVKIDNIPRSSDKPIGKHINHSIYMTDFIFASIELFNTWEDRQDGLKKSTIQIGSQKTSSRDYVKPDEDDEDCFKWWRGLFAIIDRLILAIDKNRTLKEHDLTNFTNEELCELKEHLINTDTQFFSVASGYLKSRFGGKDTGISIAIEDDIPQLFVGLYLKDWLYKDEITIPLEENTSNIMTYKPASALELVKKFQNAELDLLDYINIDNKSPIMTAKLIEIYDSYLREKFDVKKNIQISSQKTSSRDYVKPDKDDEDCREWWRELHRIFNKMINALDRNATLIIDNKVEQVDNQILCEIRDAILGMDVETDFRNTPAGIYFTYNKSITDFRDTPKGGYDAIVGGLNISGAGLSINTKYSPLIFVTRYGEGKELFRFSVKIWNDTILYDLDEAKKNGTSVYDIVERFLNAELELKKHINDPNPSPFIASKLIAIYEKYVNGDVKKSITIGSQKTSGKNYVKPEEPTCKEELLKIAEKIMEFSYSDEFDMDNPTRESRYSKFYVKDYYEGMTSKELNESNNLSLETHFIKDLDEETCCLILETIDKYKGENMVEVAVRAPSANGAGEGEFIYTKEISSQKILIGIFFSWGRHIATTLSIQLKLNEGIPPSILTEIEDIFESR